MEAKTNQIKLFVPTFEIEDCLQEIRECLEIGWTGAGFKTNEFESLWSDYSGAEYSLFLNSNTAGLEIALQSLGILNNWSEASEIITTPLTFISTNHAILRNNLKPIFADVDESLCLDPIQVQDAINSNTAAVMYVGIGGNTGQLLEIAKICRAAKIPLILDAAHMAGTKYISGENFTDIADVVIYSFQAVKNLPTGDSGLLATNHSKIFDLAKKLSWLGINASTYERSTDKNKYRWMYDVEHLGSKSNGNSIMAAIAKVQLKVLDRDNEYRRSIANSYNQQLSSLSGIKTPKVYEEIVSSQHLYQIRVPGGLRDQLIENLNYNKIDVGVHYRLNSKYKMYEEFLDLCPNATQIESEILSLPMHLRLDEEDVLRVSNQIQHWWDAHLR